jgi:undecaprenyl-diphosphatase
MLPPPHPVFIRAARLSLWIGAAIVGFSVFFLVTREMLEQELFGIDHAILQGAGRIRAPWLTVAALDLTALGSSVVITLISAIALVVLLLLGDKRGALQLLLASLGAGILTAATKHIVERPRPEQLPHLISASGFSYPSGHSLAAAALYLTVAVLALRHFRTLASQATILAMALFVIALVGGSRIYLGVHFPSDVAGGMALGFGWALLLTGSFAFSNRRAGRVSYP